MFHYPYTSIAASIIFSYQFNKIKTMTTSVVNGIIINVNHSVATFCVLKNVAK
ncbi:hypothetical protein WDC_0126 [Paucilactobacillus wasatchensis]|uniref:Uncharacterized protein n=1 Tax=Paucilactobacillus wasatchensis TaxID=1335616 RepID=A0A0D1ACI8_9LACO|nr:hypothetical protein WDC_0126 [Paucilactobacillus wasatchensis]